MAKNFDLLVIGAGPGGYTAAIRGAQLGLKVACVEKEAQLGGTCLRVGCIPSKAMLEASERYHEAKHKFAEFGIETKVKLDLETMLDRTRSTVDGLTKGIAGLLKKNKIERFEGTAAFTSANEVKLSDGKDAGTTLSAKNILIATGSRVAPLKGVELDHDLIGTSTEALYYSPVPKRLVVIGAGVIGLELGSVWARLGSEVTVLEYLDRILPGMDNEMAKDAHKILKKQGLKFELGRRVTGAKVKGKGSKRVCVVESDGHDPIECDRVLLAVGRLPNTEGLAVEVAGLELDSRGRVPVNAHFETKVPGVWAIGDVIEGPMLAHKAEEEAVACVEYIATGYGHVNYDVIPSVVYTDPEIASVGKTEEELKAAGIPYRKGSFPFLANARARALGSTEGKVKMLAHAETDRVLGVHILGPRAGDLIAEAAVSMSFGASSEDIARSCHAHPTLAEVVKEAALAVDDRTINI